MEPLRAVLICPFDKVVREVEVRSGDEHFWEDVYKHLSHEKHPVDCATSIHITLTDFLWVDEEGLLKGPTHYFMIGNYPQPLAGRGLVMGIRGSETVSTTLTASKIMQAISFVGQLECQHMNTLEETVITPVGEMKQFTVTPVFKEK